MPCAYTPPHLQARRAATKGAHGLADCRQCAVRRGLVSEERAVTHCTVHCTVHCMAPYTSHGSLDGDKCAVPREACIAHGILHPPAPHLRRASAWSAAQPCICTACWVACEAMAAQQSAAARSSK